MSTFAKFPFYGEPWLDCPICGESFPRHMMQRHYKKGFLVDKLCADARAHDDYMAELIRGRERPDPSEQVVANQGPVTLGVPSFIIGPAFAPTGTTGFLVGVNSTGSINVTLGSTAPANNLCTVTFSVPFPSVPLIGLTANEPNAASVPILPFAFAPILGISILGVTTGHFSIKVNSPTALQPFVSYSWIYTAHL